MMMMIDDNDDDDNDVVEYNQVSRIINLISKLNFIHLLFTRQTFYILLQLFFTCNVVLFLCPSLGLLSLPLSLH